MTHNNYDKLSKKIKYATKHAAEESMKSEADELKDGAVVADIGVSVDGSWQKREFSSLNVVVTALSVSSGNILDTEIVPRHCKSCDLMETLNTRDPKEYEVWYAAHNCALNYQVSAPSMESVGATNIFERSVEKYDTHLSQETGTTRASSRLKMFTVNRKSTNRSSSVTTKKE